MEQSDAELVHFLRAKNVLEEFVDVLREYMPTLDGVSSGGTEARIAFDMLERMYYNAQGARLLYDEYGHNHNMAVPLSQIFRTMVYDTVICFWLFEEGHFDNRIIQLNYDFIKKNGRRLTSMFGEQRLQQTYYDWMHIAPYSFNVVEGENGEGIITPLSATMPSFEDISRTLKERVPLNTLYRTLYFIYPLLSQQAHVSAFSKELVYGSVRGKKHVFDSACLGILVCSIMLLNKIAHGDYQGVIGRMTEVKTRYYPNEA